MATKPKARSIFEEVQTAQRPAVTPGGIDGGRQPWRRGIRVWLVLLFLLVVVMVVVGGLTRLSDAGLSITEWNPVMGAIPPLTDADWQAEFAKYLASPQGQAQAQAMELPAFKVIYWWEWGHRQMGRVIGAVWALGFLTFLVTRRIPRGWTWRLLWLGVLGGAQGAVGWWMVHSGLQSGMTSVASYRLAVHLGLAFLILGHLGWYALHMGRRDTDLMVARRLGERGLTGAATAVLVLAFVQILLGALVAGIDAGRAFPTWPLMGDSFLPPDPFSRDPLWRNFFEDAGLVQFMHRMAGYLLVLAGLAAWIVARRSVNPSTRFAFALLALGLLGQMTLGIFTALLQADLHVAITHQLGAVLLWLLILRARFLARYPIPTTIRGTR